MNILQENKLTLIGIFLVLGVFMITSPSLNLIYAADNGEGSDGGSDNSNDNNNDNSNQGSNSNGNSQEQKEEKSQPEPDKRDNNQPNNNEVEKEKAAQEDYINDKLSDNQLPKVKDKGLPMGKIIKDSPIHPDVWEPQKGKGKGDGHYDGGYGNGKDKGNGNGGDSYHDGKDGHYGDKGGSYHDGNGKSKGHYGHHSKGDHQHHHNHNHNYHNDKHHYDHNDNKYYYYYSNDYSNNHATVILQLDYHGTNDVHDVNIEIGNDFDATFDLAGEPENLVITGLDLDNGENFDVCIENNGDVNCESGHINSQNEVDYVDIRIP
jgi:hypothetical protein